MTSLISTPSHIVHNNPSPFKHFEMTDDLNAHTITGLKNSSQVLHYVGCVEVRVLAGLVHCNGYILRPGPSYHTLYCPRGFPFLPLSPLDRHTQVQLPCIDLSSWWYCVHWERAGVYNLLCITFFMLDHATVRASAISCRMKSLIPTWFHLETALYCTFIPVPLLAVRLMRGRSAKVVAVYSWILVGELFNRLMYTVCNCGSMQQ